MNWKFLFDALTRMGFPALFIDWIKLCVTTLWLVSSVVKLVSVKENPPLSFVIAMEVFTTCLKVKRLLQILSITNKLSLRLSAILHLHMMFTIWWCNISGLALNAAKSEFFFSNVPVRDIHRVLFATNFTWSELPARYLGIPLITTKLKTSDCQPLVNKLCDRVQCWTTNIWVKEDVFSL